MVGACVACVTLETGLLIFNVSSGRPIQAAHDWHATDIFIVVFEGLTCPNTWESPDPCDPYRRSQLSPESSEYKKVLENVIKTHGCTVKQIIEVCIDLRSSLCILNALINGDAVTVRTVACPNIFSDI